ncbi:MAG: ABC transporter substrate-binding protein [Acidimicrobiia bacterium]
MSPQRAVVVLGVGAVVVFALGIGFLLTGDGDNGGDRAAEPGAGGRGGGTLRMGVVGLDTLDPLEARTPAEVMVADHLFDTLVGYDPQTSEPVGELAASWEVNEDQTVFTFRLRNGAIFHDESPVTSADVKFTLERVAGPESTSPLLAQVEAIAGFAAYHSGSAEGLAGIETPDPSTVVVRLDRPFSVLPAALGHPGLGIVPAAAVEAAGAAFADEPVGSGPFRFGSRVGDRLRLSRFGGAEPPARVDRIDVMRFDDAGAAYRAFVGERLDLSPVPPDVVPEAAARHGTRGMRPVGVLFYALNVAQPDLADTRFRHAISLAVDRERILREVYDNAAEPASALIAAGVPGYLGDACRDRCRHDPERARELVAEVFTADEVPEVTIDHDDDPRQAAVAVLLERDLEAVGIPAVARSHPFDAYGTHIVSGDQEMFRYGWVGAYVSPDAYLAPLFSSDSPENLVGLDDPDIDAGITSARAEPDPVIRQEIYRQVEQRVFGDHVAVLIAELETRMVVSERVDSFLLNPLGTFDGAAVTLLP